MVTLATKAVDAGLAALAAFAVVPALQDWQSVEKYGFAAVAMVLLYWVLARLSRQLNDLGDAVRRQCEAIGALERTIREARREDRL